MGNDATRSIQSMHFLSLNSALKPIVQGQSMEPGNYCLGTLLRRIAACFARLVELVTQKSRTTKKMGVSVGCEHTQALFEKKV